MAYNLGSYEDVDSRIHVFYGKHGLGRIITELVSIDYKEGWCIFKAYGYRNAEDTEPAAVGYCDGSRKDRGVDALFWIPNAETSAIGRMLANLGLSAKGKRPSSLEMQRVAEYGNTQIVTAAEIAVQNPIDAWTTVNKPMPQPVDFEARVADIIENKLADPTACAHGMRERKQGTKKDGKPWMGDMCPEKVKDCTVWYQWSVTNQTWGLQK